ncbi:MAG: right-handed parallel beta-helix repeat-containing protein, partial [Phycisphaerales bacterium]|nr:right-handed parallel beta-helix repeat-containing protein [Phycisphaerales bacterium]
YIENITFTGNRATNGGGINFQAASSRPIRSCRFIGNHATLDGGGIFADPVANFIPIVNCLFEGNTAGDDGGGFFYRQGIQFDTAFLYNTVFRNNAAGSTGGALWFNAHGSTIPLKIANCEFAENTAGIAGGAVWVFGGATIDPSVGAVIPASRVTCNTSTFVSNSAGESGGAVFLDRSDRTDAFLNATNCIFWNNDAEVDATATPTAIISTSIVEHGWAGGGGGGVFDADPLFLDAPSDLRLASLSPAIDRGDTLNIPGDYFDLDADTIKDDEIPFDLLAQGRRFDAWADDTPIVPSPVIDLGAHESRAACRADINGDGTTDTADLGLFIGFFSAGDARAD